LIGSEGNPIEIRRSLRFRRSLFNSGAGPFPASGEKITFLGSDYKVERVRDHLQVFFWVDVIDFTR